MYKHSRMTIPTSGTHLGGRDGGGRDVGGPCGGGGKAINQGSSIKFDTCWRLFTTYCAQRAAGAAVSPSPVQKHSQAVSLSVASRSSQSREETHTPPRPGCK